MPAKLPHVADDAHAGLTALGQAIRDHRKVLRISATAAAEAAGMSRVTWHRVEAGEASVTMGAYLNAAAVLGLAIGLQAPAKARPPAGWIPARIALDDYPGLKRLAWQVHGGDTLSPSEALGIYERNWRHLDADTLPPHERELIDALRMAFADGRAGDV